MNEPQASAVLEQFAPTTGELAVLSVLATRESTGWVVVCGSLLTVQPELAYTSWKRWREMQLPTRGAHDRNGLDIGPQFGVEPFFGVWATREIVASVDWHKVVADLDRGIVKASSSPPSTVRLGNWTSSVLLSTDGSAPASSVVRGALRPVTAVACDVDAPHLPETEFSWTLPLPPQLERGRERGELYVRRTLTDWPSGLLGIDWPANTEVSPPTQFVVGRPSREAWIADMKPGENQAIVNVLIGWDESLIDPLSCSLLLRTETSGLPVMVYQVRMSDLPSKDEPAAGLSPNSPTWIWERSWHERLLTIALSRGPRHTDFGVALLAPDGRLLDERPVAPRVESVSVVIKTFESEESPSPTVNGDQATHSSPCERDEALRAATKLEAQTREAAAARRFSTAGELESYLQWRFSCRAGELLLLDAHLFGSAASQVLEFLKSLKRPVRALTAGSIRDKKVRTYLDAHPEIDVRRIPGGEKTLHDRVWIVGDTGLLVGASPGGFLKNPKGKPRRASTATEMPHADVGIWISQFEQWWAKTHWGMSPHKNNNP